jgi:DNA polymerase-3 subunit epsilon
MSTDFATFDFETTGLFPKNDRVLEIGIVRTSRTGKVVAEFSSLINPGRDVGASHIHGVTAGMLADAPTFEEIAGEIAEVVNGAVLVAHNASFDRRFLKAELDRIGRHADDLDVLCTLQLMYANFPKGPRKLVDCCREFGIVIENAHCAYDDAKMASELLHLLLGEFDLAKSVAPAWIDLDPRATRKAVPRNSVQNPRKREASYLAGLIAGLPEVEDVGFTSASSVAQYMNLLDAALEDRKLEEHESDALAEAASELNLSADRVNGIHGAYVANLCALALQDQVVTKAERKDLEDVANLLQVQDWEALLEIPKGQRAKTVSSQSSTIQRGMSVCFTGEMEYSRSDIESISRSWGLEVKSGVSRSLDLLVMADADSISGKAKKAREYGTRILAEQVFLRMIGELPN